jgi:hypothetical protein
MSLRFCKCKHVEGTHWGGDAVEEALVGHPLPFKCHAKSCGCTRFESKRGSWVRRLLIRDSRPFPGNY